MSRHFELMQAVQEETRRSSVSEPATVLLPGPEVVTGPQRDFQEFDRVAREECLRLVQRVFLSQPANVCRTIVFAGVDRGNGCSRICIESARTLAANSSRSVCLVDANFRSPSLARFFGVPERRGLADSVLEECAVRNFVRQLEPSNLSLLPAGFLTADSVSLLNSERLMLRLHELRTEFDYVLIDAPALNLYSDAVALGRAANGLIVVLEADSTRRESALKNLESLRQAGIEVLGAVLNQRTFPIPDFVYRRL
jgi:succinoglycan biosynthesis transport protein ExoP